MPIVATAPRAMDASHPYWFAMFAASVLGTNLGDLWARFLFPDRFSSLASLLLICAAAIWYDRRSPARYDPHASARYDPRASARHDPHAAARHDPRASAHDDPRTPPRTMIPAPPREPRPATGSLSSPCAPPPPTSPI